MRLGENLKQVKVDAKFYDWLQILNTFFILEYKLSICTYVQG